MRKKKRQNLLSSLAMNVELLVTVSLEIRPSKFVASCIYTVDNFLEYTMYMGSERPGLGDISTP